MGVWYLSGSVGVLSEGIHSALDLVSAAVAFFTVREAGKPADHDHPFGHGKIETLSSLFESVLLIVAAAWIVYEGMDHLVNPREVHYQELAIFTILVSMIVSYWAYRHNLKAATEVESSAIHVNALHFLSDVVASVGILIGLLVLKFTGWQPIDAIMAFSVAIYILAISLKQVKRALLELSDTQLPESEIQTIRDTLQPFEHKTIELHDLRTRKSGSTRHIDFHLVLCGHMTVHESHHVCDEMESKINTVYTGSSVNIHVEPCEHENTQCRDDCRFFQLRKKETLGNGS